MEFNTDEYNNIKITNDNKRYLVPSSSNFYPKKQNINNNFNPFPDWTPNFSNTIDIRNESIDLALGVLNMSKLEYNGMDIGQIKNLKCINSGYLESNAINILIYYKQQNNNFIKHQTNL